MILKRMHSAAVSSTLMLALLSPCAHAGLFDDDEARRAILDVRQRIEQAKEEAKARSTEQAEQLNQLRRSVLELNNQNEELRKELESLRGQQETLGRDVAEIQRKQKDLQTGVDERAKRFEPQKVTVDGKEFLADPTERQQFDDAIASLKKSDFAAAITALTTFTQRYPGSGYKESALFWLGNARYANREYKEAITAFRGMVTQNAQHPKAPEALLSIANCQSELKDSKGARKTLEELLKNYPQSEAAAAGRERLRTLK